MAGPERALSEEFWRHCRATGVKVLELSREQFNRLVTTPEEGSARKKSKVKHGVLESWRRREAIPEATFLKILRILDESQNHQVSKQWAAAIDAFAGQRDIDFTRSDQSAKLIEIMNLISIVRGEMPDGLEALLDEIWHRSVDLKNAWKPMPYDKIPEMSEWLLVEAGRDIANQPELERKEAIRVMESQVGVSKEDFCRYNQEWSNAYPYSVVGIFDEAISEFVGASLVLPLSESAYQDVRAGRLQSHRVPGNHLRVPTNRIYLEVVGQRPVDMGGTIRSGWKLREQIAMTMQVAMFADLDRLWRDESSASELRILTAVISPKFAPRIKALGFKETGTFTAGSGLPMVEITFPRGWPGKGLKVRYVQMIQLLAHRVIPAILRLARW